MSKVFAMNAGSSSFKFQLFDIPSENVITKGLVERIGLNDSVFTITVNGEKVTEVTDIPDHAVAVQMLVDKLISLGIIKSLDEINGVGHRVVHGGEIYSDSVLIDDEALANLEKLQDLAPLHNPANIVGIKAFKKALPNVPAVGVFDTAFHQTMPPESFMYSIPHNYYTEHSIRKYGFHGTSHKFVADRAAEMMGRPIEDLRIITCHLGNGASIAAVEGGKSIDTSMGFTPLAGLTMGTRSGDVDPSIIPVMMEKSGKTAQEILNVLNKESGMLGLTGISSDLRDIESAAKEGNKRAIDALDIFVKRIQDYIGSYAVRMSGVDAIVFTAGIGENGWELRERVLERLAFLGVNYNKAANEGVRGKEVEITHTDSKVKAFIIPTNEEVMIARDTMRVGIGK